MLRNKKYLYCALAVLAVLLIAVFALPWGRSGADAGGLRGMNARLTNEMSDMPELAKMDRDMRNFAKRWWIKGLSLAVMRNDSLVYAKGYGWADEEKGEEMGPGVIMRVASVSKLITAAGIMKLVEEGRLHLDDRVFGPDGILSDEDFTSSIRERGYYNITVEHLLRHEGGLSVRRGDPMFTTRDLMAIHRLDNAPDQNTLTRIALGRRLAFQPGKGHEYSNFGYLLLSMIIEKVTGEDYEHWMQKNVLDPAGCMDMHLAYNYYEQKYPNETRYHMQDNDPKVPEYNGSADSVVRCYGGNDIRALKGAGAWVCSAPELARFVASIDGRPEVRDIISGKSVSAMTSAGDHKYGLGWSSVSPTRGWKRTGSLSGTSAFVMYYPDGECWILISNTHMWKGPRFARTLNNFVAECRKRYSGRLPSRNLFDF